MSKANKCKILTFTLPEMTNHQKKKWPNTFTSLPFSPLRNYSASLHFKFVLSFSLPLISHSHWCFVIWARLMLETKTVPGICLMQYDLSILSTPHSKLLLILFDLYSLVASLCELLTWWRDKGSEKNHTSGYEENDVWIVEVSIS